MRDQLWANQPVGKKVQCYWERLGEQLGNPWGTLWEHIENMMGTRGKRKKYIFFQLIIYTLKYLAKKKCPICHADAI
jgi:hypothetical protein